MVAKKSMSVELLNEQVVERTAAILGQYSAAALALADAKVRRERGEDVVLAKHGHSILVLPASAIVQH